MSKARAHISLNEIKSLIDSLEALIHLLEALINLLEAFIDSLEARINLLEALVDLPETLIDAFLKMSDMIKLHLKHQRNSLIFRENPILGDLFLRLFDLSVQKPH